MSIDPASMIGADYKSALQERLQAAGGPGPDYAVVEVLGPDHRRTFRVELRIGGRAVATGEGHTIKLAQQEAARVVLESPEDLMTSRIEARRNAASSNTLEVESPIQPDRDTLHHEEGASVYEASDDRLSQLEVQLGSTSENGRSMQSAENELSVSGKSNDEISSDEESQLEVLSVSNDV